ncbi:transcriptional regulatory [Fusarium acutatum]|uniref:Transcriptional regulatory n=1 Tax=Fusarium acutatum TaxID=78861 RepID=A0A8H4NCA1_9HYPO|nr:transcriptional regulatory [Fusarium acutatum]
MSSLANSGLARYACDYCKQKKFRCSKELPKCIACQPWPGPCNYSRDKPALKGRVNERATRPSLDLTNRQSIERLHERLQKVEEAVQALTPTVTEGVEAVNYVPSTNYQQVSEKECESQDGKDPRSNLSVGDVTSFSFLKDISITNTTIGSSPLHQHAAKEFQYLSDSLTTAGVTSKSCANSGFFVPSEGEGYQMIGRFLENASLGDAFFITPSENLLIQTIFSPETVSKKAWVVYINYMILNMLARNEVARAQKYRNNMKLALDDSRIFLEPHEVNLQALIMLAIHGEDYSSPNQSWMLVGHACRQAEALRLHTLSESDYETRQRKLSLFWLLFAVDKSCALAFGRPCCLPSATYSHVPLPDLRYLTKFQPRRDSPVTARRTERSVFGGHMFLARLELAQMIGKSLDTRHIPEPEDGLRERLGEWYARTNKILSDTLQSEKAFSGPNELREMELGISTIKFEYLHVSMVLLKSHSPSANLRLETAREAMSLLPSMVSNWTSIYNSMIWHLLYYPFIPYFIIFENLVHKHALLNGHPAGPCTSASSEPVEQESRGTKRPFDVMFDWFAWDVYYGEQSGKMAELDAVLSAVLCEYLAIAKTCGRSDLGFCFTSFLGLTTKVSKYPWHSHGDELSEAPRRRTTISRVHIKKFNHFAQTNEYHDNG